METIVAISTLAFVLGLQHSLEIDHVIAISTLTTKTSKLALASRLGALWGLGHTLPLFIATILVFSFKIVISEQMSSFFELGVGLLLIALGIHVLINRNQNGSHSHGDVVHTHGLRQINYTGKMSFLVGIVHGLAGSSLLVLLLITTVPSVWMGLLFVAAFGLGTIVGMMTVGLFLSIPVKLSSSFPRFQQAINVLSGIGSLLLGISLIYTILFIDKTFVI